jgi:hypothetical protein
MYDIEAESEEELEEYEKKYISVAYRKGVVQDFPRVVLNVMEKLAVEDENYEMAKQIRDAIACNDESE